MRAYPDAEQVSVLNRTFGCVRYVWNRTLAWRHARYHGEQVKTNFTQANAYLTAMKATEELAWLNEVSSVPLQQAIRHQQVAYANFFARRARYPRFKSRAVGSPPSTPAPVSGTATDSCSWPKWMRRWCSCGRGRTSTRQVSTVHGDCLPGPCGRWYVSFAIECAIRCSFPRRATLPVWTWGSRTSP